MANPVPERSMKALGVTVWGERIVSKREGESLKEGLVGHRAPAQQTGSSQGTGMLQKDLQ